MRIGIYGAGQFVKNVDQNIPFIGVDGGVLALNRLHITPLYIIGDFDSMDEKLLDETILKRKLPCKKDFTDTEVAIMEAIERGYDEIDLYGVTGGRLDHFFAVCRQLVYYSNIKITIIDNNNRISILKKGQHSIKKNGYDYISFFSIKDTFLTIKDCVYNLDGYLLKYQDSLCVSNEISDQECYIENSEDIFMVQSRKELI